MKKTLSVIKLILLLLFFIIVIELFTRVFLFFLTNKDIFKYGFKKSVIFEVLDLSKLQISIIDKDLKFPVDQLIKGKNLQIQKKIWIFGASTTYGYVCEGQQSSSWPDEISKINKNFIFKNYALPGVNSDNQINLLLKNIVKYSPDIILWANKFNTNNILAASSYRNQDILKYKFINVKKTKFLFNIKRLDKSLKSYLIFYSLLDKIIFRINHKYYRIIETIKIKPSQTDVIYSVKNFELNTIEAIEASIKFGVKEFYIVSLFSEDDLIDKKRYKIELYEQAIKKIENLYYPIVKIINSGERIYDVEISEVLCDKVHKKYKGNILQADIINNKLMQYSNIYK